MNKTRVEAFSDGVIAIIITIMVLNLKIPSETTIAGLFPQIPTFFSYTLSFLYIGTFWSNHHHMLQTAKHVSGGMLWANLHLLFWLSFFPFATGWVGLHYRASVPMAFYGFILFMAASAYFILQYTIIATHGRCSTLARAVGYDIKGKLSLLLYTSGILLSFYIPWLAYSIYIFVAFMWLIPDQRIERIIG